jgi:retron-type reverse transcriptase
MANGGERPLGIPTIKDRIAQTVCKTVLEPIFEADFEDSSYGFRPNRSSKDAMRAIKGHLEQGNTEVLDVGLSRYFGTIPLITERARGSVGFMDKKPLRYWSKNID